MYTVPDQTGRTFVVTGANSGTGREATRRLAAAGAKVIMAVRTPEKGDTARLAILAEVPGADLEVRRIDLADLASIHSFVQGITDDGVGVDVLVNNAGVMIPPSRIPTADGFELQFGSNFLGPFALTMLLLPNILKSKHARVATMSSGVANVGRIRFDDPNWQKRYSASRAYAQSKLADMVFAERLAELAQQHGWPLLSTIAHPGFTRTNLQTAGRNLGRPGDERPPITSSGIIPSQGVEQGAEPLLFAAADPGAEQGAYYGPNRLGLVGPTKKVKLPRAARRAEVPEKLWAMAEELTGTSLPN
jgi:NAD(P)-dependent dehydrogenase (short-subunit alcohol dehydrogenase family)